MGQLSFNCIFWEPAELNFKLALGCVSLNPSRQTLAGAGGWLGLAGAGFAWWVEDLRGGC
jgi:hypothetical protein